METQLMKAEPQVGTARTPTTRKEKWTTGLAPYSKLASHPVFTGLLIVMLALVAGATPANGESSTTIYVGRHFEVREHDQPVKYVWNGKTRVARVTGSLQATRRIQRLRFFRGWNLCSLGVTITNAV